MLKLLVAAVAFALPVAANATIIATGGAVTELGTPPGSVVEGALTSDSQIFVFTEQLGYTLAGNATVDVAAPGTYDAGSLPGSSPIAAGTAVDAYFVHFDTASGSGSFTLSGSITFDRDVLGLAGLDATIDPLDAVFGVSGTTYPSGTSARGYWEGPDSVTLSADRRTVTFNNMTVFAGFTDQLRIITAVPEPSTGLLMAIGLGGLAHAQRRAGRARARA